MNQRVLGKIELWIGVQLAVLRRGVELRSRLSGTMCVGGILGILRPGELGKGEGSDYGDGSEFFWCHVGFFFGS